MSDHGSSSTLLTIVLGDEHDQGLREALRAVLIESGAGVLERTWGVGGSQEIESLEVSIGNDRMTIEAETFIGLSLIGPRPLVEHIAELVGRKRRRPTSP
jgi:DNA-binding transcriptional regulator PaaX